MATPPEMVAAYEVVLDVLRPFKTIDGDLRIGPVRAANLVVSALAKAELLTEQGQAIVSAEDLRTYLDRGKDLKAEVDAFNRLRAALPERTENA